MSEIVAEAHDFSGRRKGHSRQPSLVVRKDSRKQKGRQQDSPPPPPQQSASEPEGEPESEPEPDCRAILAAESTIGVSNDATKANAEDSLSSALKGPYYIEDHEGRFFAANELGLTYARLPGEYEDLKRRYDTVNRSLAEFKDSVASKDEQISDLKSQVEGLTRSLEFYKESRQRFICVFKRDKLNNETAADREIIRRGNQVVHGGDAVTDAFMYNATCAGRRTDPGTFDKLYGVLPSIAENISK